jgi:methionyl aminopeptidase
MAESINPKTPSEIKVMREGGKRHAEILQTLIDMCVVGESSFKIEEKSRALFEKLGVKPAFYNYVADPKVRPFPATMCFSVNDAIVHGIPNEAEIILSDGDVVSIDIGVVYEGLITDAADSIIVGENDPAKKLLVAARNSLKAGIKAAQAYAPVSDIGAAIEKTVKTSGDYTIYRGLVGHGVGYQLHEEPNIPNFHTGSRNPILPEGAVLAIEPMIGLGSPKFKLDPDQWTYRTIDGSISVQVEHTVAVTSNGPLILTTL